MIESADTIEALRSCSSFEDEEFMAEEYMVQIQPHFNTGESLRFISQECGPFDRRTPISVPLWIATYLEKHGKCTIIPPSWMTVAYMKSKIREERENGTESFAKFDDTMVQVAMILLNRDYLLSEYIGGPNNRNAILTLVHELLLLRKAKIVEGLKQVDVTSAVIDITNMTSVERASIRPHAVGMMDELRKLWTIREAVLGAEPRGM